MKDIGAKLAPMSVVEGQLSPYYCYYILIAIFIQQSTLALLLPGQGSLSR